MLKKGAEDPSWTPHKNAIGSFCFKDWIFFFWMIWFKCWINTSVFFRVILDQYGPLVSSSPNLGDPPLYPRLRVGVKRSFSEGVPEVFAKMK